jgi:hypothetical protein
VDYYIYSLARCLHNLFIVWSFWRTWGALLGARIAAVVAPRRFFSYASRNTQRICIQCKIFVWFINYFSYSRKQNKRLCFLSKKLVPYFLKRSAYFHCFDHNASNGASSEQHACRAILESTTAMDTKTRLIQKKITSKTQLRRRRSIVGLAQLACLAWSGETNDESC